MPDQDTKKPNRCHPPQTPGGDVALTIIDDAPTIRPSKMGRKRAMVLGAVQVLMILHVIQWAITGRTMSPVEPSESMEFVKEGVVNAGLVFFAITLLSTLIFGRWFCGWGCHVVLLQDLCGWIMKKIGLRPKPFRSRLLIYIPLVLALYMFIWPAFHRLAIEPWLSGPSRHPEWVWRSHLSTEAFWATFPGVMVAIPFLLICGFATVYFLGAKGFCTYGCPYGGFFAPLDEFAPGRIRVNDDCEQCGHCTAVCTSNVRVHDEVREYGMVVDPGCMKCMDCVSVCPNDALSFGFGTPAISKGAPRNETPKRVFDLTWPEEIVFTIVCIGAFFAVRSVYGIIPMLMAIGMAICITFLTWQASRLLRDDNVAFHRMRLKYRGRIRVPGFVMLSITTLVVALTIHSGFIRVAHKLGDRADRRLDVPMGAVFAPGRDALNDATRAETERTLHWFDLASSIRDGGIGLLRTERWQGPIDVRRAWLLSILGRYEDALAIIDTAITRAGLTDPYATSRFVLLVSTGHPDEAYVYAETVLTQEKSFHGLVREIAATARRWGRMEEAISVLNARLAMWPGDAPTILQLAEVYAETGRPSDAEPLYRQLVDAQPLDIRVRAELARMLAQQNRFEDALAQLETAVAQRPEEPMLRIAMSEILTMLGRVEEAQAQMQRARQLTRP